MKAADWIDRLKAEREWDSDYRVAKELETSRQTISTYRSRPDATMDDDMALKVARELKIEPVVVLLDQAAERTKSEPAREAINAALRKITAAGLAALAFIGGPTPPPANAAAGANSAPLYIMSNGTRKRRRKGAMAHVAGALARMRDALAPHALLIPA